MKSKIKSVVSVILSLALVITSITITPADTTTANTIINKTFKMPDLLNTTTNYTGTYYYTDDYFAESSYKYNASLATMSMCMASASPGVVEGSSYANCSKNLRTLLTEVGFDTIYFNEDYDSKPTGDTIGFSFAKKTIKVNGENYTLVVVNFRNGLYGKEWKNNVDLFGNTTDHTGFLGTATKVYDALTEYFAENNIKDNIKIWIAGYSRGGGIANLLAERINSSKHVNYEPIDTNNLYTYTFGCPNTTKGTEYKRTLYKNIFNIILANDIVPQIAPEQWNWHRYGQVIQINDPEGDVNYEAKKARAQKFLDLMVPNATVSTEIIGGLKVDLTDISNPIILPDKDKKVSEIFDDVLTALSHTIESEENLSKSKPAIDAAIDFIMDSSSETQKTVTDKILADAQEVGLSTLMTDLLFGGTQAADIIINALEEAGIEYENVDELKTSLNATLLFLLQAITYDANKIPSAIISVYNSIDKVIANHLNYSYLAWLQSIDPNYKLDSDIPGPDPVPPVRKPGKATITKVTRKSSKKLVVKIKKVSTANGYKVYVYKTKKNANKKSGSIATKVVKKNQTKITISSKKFKKPKTLYVRVRAYKNNNGKKLYGAWSKVKKIKRK